MQRIKMMIIKLSVQNVKDHNDDHNVECVKCKGS